MSFDICSAPAQEGIALFTTTIRDNGIGMTKEFLAHIFEAFTRERSSTESRRPGFGLGMGIAKKLTELMGGTIAVESEPGKGTLRSGSRIASPKGRKRHSLQKTPPCRIRRSKAVASFLRKTMISMQRSQKSF